MPYANKEDRRAHDSAYYARKGERKAQEERWLKRGTALAAIPQTPAQAPRLGSGAVSSRGQFPTPSFSYSPEELKTGRIRRRVVSNGSDTEARQAEQGPASSVV